MTDVIMTLDITAIKARADKVNMAVSRHEAGRGHHYIMFRFRMKNDAQDFQRSIVEQRADIPALIAALEASEAAIATLEDERDELAEEVARFNEHRGSKQLLERALKAEQERDADMKRAYLKGRTQWCPAGILDDTERTERDWQSARRVLEASK